MFTHRANGTFWAAYNRLSKQVQVLADKQFTLLAIDPWHPSLRLKKLTEQQGYDLWSARVSKNYRALALRADGTFTWFWIGDHSGYDRRIG